MVLVVIDSLSSDNEKNWHSYTLYLFKSRSLKMNERIIYNDDEYIYFGRSAVYVAIFKKKYSTSERRERISSQQEMLTTAGEREMKRLIEMHVSLLPVSMIA